MRIVLIIMRIVAGIRNIIIVDMLVQYGIDEKLYRIHSNNSRDIVTGYDTWMLSGSISQVEQSGCEKESSGRVAVGISLD